MNKMFPQKAPLTILTIYIQEASSKFEDWMDGDEPYFVAVKNIQPEDFLNFDFFKYTIENFFNEQQQTDQFNLEDIIKTHKKLLEKIKNGEKDISFEINIGNTFIDSIYQFNFVTI